MATACAAVAACAGAVLTTVATAANSASSTLHQLPLAIGQLYACFGQRVVIATVFAFTTATTVIASIDAGIVPSGVARLASAITIVACAVAGIARSRSRSGGGIARIAGIDPAAVHDAGLPHRIGIGSIGMIGPGTAPAVVSAVGHRLASIYLEI